MKTIPAQKLTWQPVRLENPAICPVDGEEMIPIPSFDPHYGGAAFAYCLKCRQLYQGHEEKQARV